MTQYVAFIRAINVAGHARIKMRDVREAFSAAGCQDVRSVIQSDNVLFAAPEASAERLFQDVRSQIRDLIGAEPNVMFHKLSDVNRIVERDPFRDIDRDTDVKLYVAFLSRSPRNEPKLPIHSPKEALEVIGFGETEAFIVSRRKANGFYGFPNNFIEKELGIAATSRNWSTVRKIAQLIDD